MSSCEREVEFTRWVLLHVIRGQDQDYSVARDLGLTAEDVDDLLRLTAGDLERVAEQVARSRALAVQVDRQTVRQVIESLRTGDDPTAVVRRLIKADAPLVMMRSLFGMSERQFSRLRRAFGFPDTSPGRPTPTDDQRKLVWFGWEEVLTRHGMTLRDCGPPEYLEVHDLTQVPMRIIWMLSQSWIASSSMPVADPRGL